MVVATECNSRPVEVCINIQMIFKIGNEKRDDFFKDEIS